MFSNDFSSLIDFSLKYFKAWSFWSNLFSSCWYLLSSYWNFSYSSLYSLETSPSMIFFFFFRVMKLSSFGRLIKVLVVTIFSLSFLTIWPRVSFEGRCYCFWVRPNNLLSMLMIVYWRIYFGIFFGSGCCYFFSSFFSSFLSSMLESEENSWLVKSWFDSLLLAESFFENAWKKSSSLFEPASLAFLLITDFFLVSFFS